MSKLLAAIDARNRHNKAIKKAFSAFNHAFEQRFLPVTPIKTPEPIPPFCPIDEPLQQALAQQIQATTDPFQANLFIAVLHVYRRMNIYRSHYQLIYHQPRHAAEVFSDLHRLLQQDERYNTIHLLAVLCGLFHDGYYSRQRISDEIASSEALKNFLKPLLMTLSPAHQNIIAEYNQASDSPLYPFVCAVA